MSRELDSSETSLLRLCVQLGKEQFQKHIDTGCCRDGALFLAMAILFDHFSGDDRQAQLHAQAFLHEVVATWQRNAASITDRQIQEFLADHPPAKADVPGQLELFAGLEARQ
jgi:hypothetical protein